MTTLEAECHKFTVFTLDPCIRGCHCILMLFLAYPVEATRCGAATLFIQNIVEKENINAEMMLFTSKLEPSRSHRTYLLHFLKGHLSPLHSSLAQESCMSRKPCKINVSSTFKKHFSRLYGSFSPSHCISCY